MIEVSLKTTIDAPADAVWAIVGDFNALPRFIAAATRSEVAGEGIGAVRTLTLPDGATLRERLEDHDSGNRSLEYTILDGPLPVADYRARMTVVATGDRSCEMRWASTFEPSGTDEEEARRTIAGIYEMGFEGLRQLFVHGRADRAGG